MYDISMSLPAVHPSHPGRPTIQAKIAAINYNSSFALMHEDHLDDSIPVDLGVDRIRVHVLSPVDLAVSKIARFADNDKEDIATLVRLGLTTADGIEQRATSALAGYIGGQAMLQRNLRDAVALARQVETERLAARRSGIVDMVRR
jgi:hypothetical protein